MKFSYYYKNKGKIIKMYYISVEDSFSSAHQLREYKGKCEKLHGHNWLIKVIICGEKLDKAGMLIDFVVLKKYLKEELDYLDHQFLNELEPFNKINPSAENLSYFLYNKMQNRLNNYQGISVYRVDVWESSKSCASFLKSEEHINV